MNSVNIVGNLCDDVEVRHLPDGTPVVSGSLAWNKPRRNSDGSWGSQAHFFNFRLWGERFEKLSRYLNKGVRVGLSGELIQQTWEKDGVKHYRVIIESRQLDLLTTKAEREEIQGGKPVSSNSGGSQMVEPKHVDNDDDIPF